MSPRRRYVVARRDMSCTKIMSWKCNKNTANAKVETCFHVLRKKHKTEEIGNCSSTRTLAHEIAKETSFDGIKPG